MNRHSHTGPEELKENSRTKQGVRHANSRKSLSPSTVSQNQWNDWQWHVRNRITTAAELERWIPLSVEEKRAIQFSQGKFRFSLTPFWASLMDPSDFFCPIRRQSIPLDEEFRTSVHEHSDFVSHPSGIARGRLTHAYPDRAVLSVHSQCILYCRFCPQKRIAEQNENGAGASFSAYREIPTLLDEDWHEVLAYLKNHPEIQEIILSGGEPLLLNDEVLRKFFSLIKSVPSVTTLRVETRVPSVLPQRITPALIQTLKEAQPLYLVLHVNHPGEISPEFAEACARLVDSGIPLASETVLLREINDKPHILSALFLTLFKLRVRPYRLIQSLPSKGTDHFRTTISMGLRLVESLRGRMAGLALPEYVVDTPGGRVPLMYESILSRNRKRVLLKNYEGKVYVYPEKIFSFSS